MNYFKKCLLTISLGITLVGFAPVNIAEAGLILITPDAGSYWYKEPEKDWLAGAFLASSLALFAIKQPGLGVITLLLDTNGNVDESVLTQKLKERYPFLDNSESIRNLSETIQSKVPTHLNQQQSYLVSLSENETRSALNGSDLTEEQIQNVIQDLK
jgi:hypothetical protein